MKTQLIICGTLVIALGAYAALPNTQWHASAARNGVVESTAVQPAAAADAASQVTARGEYLEVRHVLSPERDQATLAWRVREGSHLGVPLEGLAIVALVSGKRAEMSNSRTTLLVDARANEAQQAALVAMARAFAPNLTRHVESIAPAKIDLNVCRGCALGYASLDADAVTVRTRRLLDSDKNDGTAASTRPTLANVYFGRPAFTLEHSYSGYDAAGHSLAFTVRDAASAMVGEF